VASQIALNRLQRRGERCLAGAAPSRALRRSRSAAEEPMVCGLSAGGNRIRTIGPAEKETAVEGGPAADHRRLARRPVLNDHIQLIGPASLVGNSRDTFHKSGTDGSNPVPSSKESATKLTGKIEPALARNRRFESSSLQR